MSSTHARTLCFFVVAVFAPWLCQAAGRIEINQVIVDVAGGFPYSITSPGSYVLTSDLVVTSDSTALIVQTNQVDLDLNGFAIRGNSACSIFFCPAGSSNGIGFAFLTGNDVTVRNGRVTGFTGDCITLVSQARVEDVSVSACGRSGIALGLASQSIGNRVVATGENGISLGSTSLYEGNVVSASNIGGGTAQGIVGGSPSGGNACADASCTRRGEKRYYLSSDFVGSTAAPNSCAAGFHFASFWELRNFEQLVYDTNLGLSRADSGSGPPAGPGTAGWARTGLNAEAEDPNTATIFIQPANCDAWASTASTDYGTRFNLSNEWEEPSVTHDPWEMLSVRCNGSHFVWCVED